MKALLLRNAVALIVLAAIAAAFAVVGTRHLIKREPIYHPAPAMTAAEAGRIQQGVPVTYGQTLDLINTELAFARKQAEAQPTGSYSLWEELANTYLDRARLTSSFEDYVAAGQAFDRAFAVADRGLGPHISHAGYNIALHRLGRVEPDLVAVEQAKVPDRAQLAVVAGMRGDVAFYSGRYADALTLYERSHTMTRSLGTAFRLANYWGRMGDEKKAQNYLNEAESGLSGPKQETHAFLEMTRGILAMDHGRWDEAQYRFHRADLIFPGHWLIQEYLARTIGLRGKPDKAMALFKAIFQRTGLPEPADAIAGLYRSQGDRAQSEAWAAKAQGLWEKRLALIPEAAYGHALDHVLAYGDPRTALMLAERNFATRPYAEAATGLAWAYMANHRPADAVRVIEPVLSSGWTASEPHIVAAEAYALLGRSSDADAQRRAALAINPHSFDRNPGMVWLEH